MTWTPGGDPLALRRAADEARLRIEQLPPDHPERPRLESVVDLDAVLSTLAGEGRWTDDVDVRLTRLDRFAAAPSPGTDPQFVLAVRAQAATLRGGRLFMRLSTSEQSPQERACELETAIAETEDALRAVRQHGGQVASSGDSLHGVLAGLLAARAGVEVDERDGPDAGTRAVAAARPWLDRAEEHLRHVPQAQRAPVAQVIEMTRTALERGSEAAMSDPGFLAADYEEVLDAGGIPVAHARALTLRAQQTRDRGDIEAAIRELRDVRRRLPAAHVFHQEVLAALSMMLGLRAVLTMSGEDATEALDAGILVAEAGAVADRQTLQPLWTALTLVGGLDLRSGPFHRAASAIETLLGRGEPHGPVARFLGQASLGTARALIWRGSNDPSLLRRAREALDAAEPLLPDSGDLESLQWAMALLQVNLQNALLWGDREAAIAGERLLDRVEARLRSAPQHAQSFAAMTMPGVQNPFGTGGGGVLGMLGSMRQMLRVLSALPAFDGGPGGSVASTLLESVRAQMRGAMAAGGASVATPTGPWSAAGGLLSIPPAPAGPPAGGGGTPPAPPTSAPVSGADARTQAREALARAKALLPGLAPGAIGVRRRRALSRQGRPSAGDLTGLGDQLRAALSAGMPDSDLRHDVRHALALVLAELHWTGATSGNARHLAETVRTLEEVSSVGDRRGPTVRHAELLDVLARCYHEQARLGYQPTGSPVRTVRAALRELGRSVLLARTSDEALDLASLAGDIVHRTVSWCLADGDPRRAVEIAEAGRALVLASAVLGGRVADLLRELNRPDLAEAWSLAGSAGEVDVGAGERTRLAALEVLSREPLGLMILVPPRVDDVMTAAVAAGLDAVVVLVPPAPSEGLGPDETPPPDLAHAILVRSTGDVDVVRLEGLRVGSGSALGEYVEALEALLEPDDATRDELIEASLSGFGYRGTSRGRLWLAALDRLGAEAYEVVVRPLIEHIDRWGLGHLPHIALVPLDVLGAVPYAAAWRRDTDLPGGRRYAVHDLVLSMAASARLLARAAARPRRRLNESVVFVSDPDGTLPLAGIAAEAVVDALYPEARRYGVGAPDGRATAETVLAALLGGADGIPASLLHLGTHAESTDAGTSAALALQEDEKLPLPRLLAAATSRRPDAPGGLVVCDACVTDTIRHGHDESLTLATTFLAAGAKGTIGTRWPVDDDAAAVMTYLLHAELLRQPTAAHALRAAQLAMLEDRPIPEKMPEELSMTTYPGRMTEPASWAAYTFHGA